MALQPASVYHLLQKVFTLFEEGELKWQQAVRLSGAGLQKALQGKNCAKLYHFKMFQGLEVHVHVHAQCGSSPDVKYSQTFPHAHLSSFNHLHATFIS